MTCQLHHQRDIQTAAILDRSPWITCNTGVPEKIHIISTQGFLIIINTHLTTLEIPVKHQHTLL